MSAPHADTIRILLVTPVRLYREGLASILGDASGLAIIGAEPDWRNALSRMIELVPDVVLLDMTVAEDQAFARELAQNVLNIPIVGFGVDGSEDTLVACAEAGVIGCLTDSASRDELIHVVKAASRGEVICSPQLAGALVRRLATLAANHRSPSLLHVRFTRREREVARLLEQNLTNKEIATRLGIEVATVKNHVHNLLEKLSVHRRDEAARVLGGSRSLKISGPYVAADL